MRFIIKNQKDKIQARNLIKDCKNKIVECCSLFNEKISKTVSDLLGIDLDLYDLSQKNAQRTMLDFCRVDCCLGGMKIKIVNILSQYLMVPLTFYLQFFSLTSSI